MRRFLLTRRLASVALSTLIGAVALGFSPAMADEGILGEWARGDGNARVRIAPCGGALCAVNTWIRDPSSGEHVGDRLVLNVASAGRALSGTAYDPQRKLNYSMSIEYGPKSMQTRGCVLAGIVCKSISWARLSR
jgi:uncharacterized protein (DUF2147 family)